MFSWLRNECMLMITTLIRSTAFTFYVCLIVLSMSIYGHLYDLPSTLCDKRTFLQDFLGILKHSLQNLEEMFSQYCSTYISKKFNLQLPSISCLRFILNQRFKQMHLIRTKYDRN